MWPGSLFKWGHKELVASFKAERFKCGLTLTGVRDCREKSLVCFYINPEEKKCNCNAVFECLIAFFFLLCVINFLNVFVTEKNGVCFSLNAFILFI